MQTVTVEKKRKLSDSEKTIAEIRELRWKLSKDIHSFKDIEKIQKKILNKVKILVYILCNSSLLCLEALYLL